MNEETITAVANVLTQWNPLGECARNVEELNGYRIEAIDIVSVLKVRGNSVKPERLVMEVLNQAFDLNLSPQSCIAAADEIVAIVGKN